MVDLTLMKIFFSVRDFYRLVAINFKNDKGQAVFIHNSEIEINIYLFSP